MDLSEPLVHFFVLELGETEAWGSSMICLRFLGQFAEELRLAVVFGPQAFPSAPCCLHHEDFSIISASCILVLGNSGD